MSFVLRTLLYYLTGCSRFKDDTLHQQQDDKSSPKDEEEAIGLPLAPPGVTAPGQGCNGPYMPPDVRMHYAARKHRHLSPASNGHPTRAVAEDISSPEFSANQTRRAQGGLRLHPATFEEGMWQHVASCQDTTSPSSPSGPASDPDGDQPSQPHTPPSLLLEKQAQLARLALELKARQDDRAKHVRSVRDTKASLRELRREVRTLKRAMKIEDVWNAHLDDLRRRGTRVHKKMLGDSRLDANGDLPPPRVHYRDDGHCTVDPVLIASLVAKML